MGSKKTLCEWNKEKLKEDFDSYKKLVGVPKFVCKKCGRAALDKKNLCKPEELQGKKK